MVQTMPVLSVQPHRVFTVAIVQLIVVPMGPPSRHGKFLDLVHPRPSYTAFQPTVFQKPLPVVSDIPSLLSHFTHHLPSLRSQDHLRQPSQLGYFQHNMKWQLPAHILACLIPPIHLCVSCTLCFLSCGVFFPLLLRLNLNRQFHRWNPQTIPNPSPNAPNVFRPELSLQLSNDYLLTNE